MSTLLGVLAILGGAALVYRLIRTLLRVGIAAVEATAASNLAEVSARRGDLSLLAERRETEQSARRSGLQNGLLAILWFLLLVLPLVLGWAREVYAIASLVWLLPRRPIRPTPPPQGRE